MLGFEKESLRMAFTTKSIRTKLLLLVAGIAVAVGAAAVVYDVVAGGGAIRDQLEKRGRYIASNLAFNARYGVLTEDRPALVNLLRGATGAGSESETSDVVGAMIRNAEGEVLAQVGQEIRNLPTGPAAELTAIETQTRSGEAVLLFRAPVTTGGERVRAVRGARGRGARGSAQGRRRGRDQPGCGRPGSRTDAWSRRCSWACSSWPWGRPRAGS